LGDAFNEWKHYRGGQVSNLVIFDTTTYATEHVPQPAGRCNDTDPMWLDGKVYFRSDRDGEFNIYSYDPASKKIAKITNHTDFPIVNATAGGGKIIYEQAGYLHLLDPKTGASNRVKVGVAADLVETLPRFIKGKKYIRNTAISPSGARAAFEFRRRTANRSRGSPTAAASTASMSAIRTAKERRARSRSTAPVSTMIRSGRPIRRRSASPTTPARST